MKYQKKCECCGHVVTAYTHKLGRQQIEMLGKLISFYQKKKRPAIISEIGLTPIQYSIFTKLDYFNFIEKRSFINHEGKSKLGRIPTANGIGFYEGKIPSPNRVASLNGIALRYDHEAWDTDKEKRKLVYRRDIEDGKSKTHEEYKDEKRKFRLKNLFE